MRIAYNNIIDDLSSGSILASTALTAYPVTNIQDQRLTTKWMTDSVSGQSVVFTLPLQRLPDIPDTAAGITYKSNWLTDVDGWTVDNATLAVSDGELVATATANGTVNLIKGNLGGATNRVIRAMYLAGRSGTVKIYGNVGGVPNTLIGTFNYAVANVWQPLDCFIAGALTSIYIHQTSMIAADVIRLRFAYVGTGEYDYPLIDGSGNANHAKVYRALPIQDTLGQMLRFNGVNAYATIPSTSELAKAFAKVGGIVGASFWVRPLAADANKYILIHEDSANNNRFFVRVLSATNIGLLVFNGSVALNIPVATNELAHITVVRSGVTGKGYAWKNGIFVNDILQTAAVATTLTDTYIGRLSSGGNFDLFGLRFFDFLPTDAQAKQLYNDSITASGIIADYNIDKKWRVNTAAVLGHNIKSGTMVKVEGNDSNEWGAPDVSETLNYIASGQTILKFLTSTYIKKYWRFTFGSQGDLSIGRLWLSDYITVSPSSLLDFKVAKKRSDLVMYGKDRQKFSNPGVGWRKFEFNFPKSDYDMIKKIEDLYDDVGLHTSFIFANFDSIRDFQLVEPCYVSFAAELNFTHSSYQKYSYGFVLEEDL